MSAFLSPALQYILYVTKTQYQLFYGLFANLASRVTASVSRMHLIVLFCFLLSCHALLRICFLICCTHCLF